MMKRLSKRLLALLLAALLLMLAGCGSGGGLSLKEAAPTGSVDTVAPEIRAFMEAAKNYTEGDYTYSEKTVDNLGNRPVPATFSWTYDGNEPAGEATVLLAKDKNMTSPVEVAAGAGQPVEVYNLETGATYYWCIEATGDNGEALRSQVYSFETKEGPRILNIPGVENARDLGGWKTADGGRIKEGVVFRSADLDELTPEGEAVILNDLGIKTELDLRNHAVEEIYSPISDKLNHVNISLLSYTDFLKSPKSAKESARVFTLPENYPILFHCVAGADRTGCLAFLLGSLCGVSETDLVTDYELTNNRFRMGVEEDDYFLSFPGFIEMFRELPGETGQEKARNFLKDQCKLSDMEIYNIVALLTGDAAVFVEPPKSAVKVKDGAAVFEIDSRSSGKIKSISANGVKYKYSYDGKILTVETSDQSETAAVLSFSDGTEMPLIWK